METNNSALLQAIGSTKFRFLDTSGVESQHSPKDREDMQTDEGIAQDSANGCAKRGHAKVLDEQGQHIGWARRNDKPIFDAAEKELRESIRLANGMIRACTIKVGGARAVPCERYADFIEAQSLCKRLADNTNLHADIQAANLILIGQGKPIIRMQFDVSWHPELTLSDPADIERTERIKASVAEAIGQVITACRSGDREQIRYVLDQVGALGESVSDPKLQADVKSILTAAETAAQKISDEGKARSAMLRSNTESKRGQAAAERFLAVSKDAGEAKNALTTALDGFESRWLALDIKSDAEIAADIEDSLTDEDRIERMKARLAREDADNRGTLLEIDIEDRIISPEAIIEIEAYKANEGIRQLEID